MQLDYHVQQLLTHNNYQDLYLTVTRKRSKKNENGRFNPLGMTRFLGLSILKMLMHVFAMHVEYSLET